MIFNHPTLVEKPSHLSTAMFFLFFSAELRLRLKACDSCQGLIVSEKQHLHSDSETEDVNTVNATENTSTRRHPPQGCCCFRWRSRKISKICAAGGVCSAVLLSISLISHIIGCFVYAVSIPRPSWTEGTNGEPSVAYWCFWAKVLVLYFLHDPFGGVDYSNLYIVMFSWHHHKKWWFVRGQKSVRIFC